MNWGNPYDENASFVDQFAECGDGAAWWLLRIYGKIYGLEGDDYAGMTHWNGFLTEV